MNERYRICRIFGRGRLGMLGVVLALLIARPSAADETPPPSEEPVTAEPAAPEPDSTAPDLLEGGDGRPVVSDHKLRITVGMGLPGGLGGLTVGDRERIYELGASKAADSSVFGDFAVGYRRGLLAVRLAIAAKVLALSSDTSATVFDGVEDQAVSLETGGGFLSASALAGVVWEPTLYQSDDAGEAGEALSLALSALGGFEHVSLWGKFSKERVPNYHHPERSFHWTVERPRVYGELALRWRHIVGGDTTRHLLGMEIGVGLNATIPQAAWTSGAIRGVRDQWGSWAAFVRLTWEIDLAELQP